MGFGGCGFAGLGLRQFGARGLGFRVWEVSGLVRVWGLGFGCRRVTI